MTPPHPPCRCATGLTENSTQKAITEGTAALRGNLKDERCWREFKHGNWNTNIGVCDFIVRNVTPYDGDEKFLAGPAERTKKEPPALTPRLADPQRHRVNGLM